MWWVICFFACFGFLRRLHAVLNAVDVLFCTCFGALNLTAAYAV